jgi:hypothetical protein
MPAFFLIVGGDDGAALLKLPADYFQFFRFEPASRVGIALACGATRSQPVVPGSLALHFASDGDQSIAAPERSQSPSVRFGKAEHNAVAVIVANAVRQRRHRQDVRKAAYGLSPPDDRRDICIC